LFKSNLDTLFAALLGGLLVLILTQHSGLGISPDSIYYMSAADSFLAGKGFYQFDDHPFVMFPVFYPFFLSIIKWVTGVNFLKVAPFINAFLFGFAILLVGRMLEKASASKYLKWLLLLILLCSASLLEVYTMLWSETLFIVEVLLFIWIAEKYFHKFEWKYLILMALIAAISSDTRLAGVSIIGTGGLLILMCKQLKWPSKIKQGFVFGLISVSFFSINLLRNAFLSQTLTGKRQKGVTPFVDNLRYYGSVLSEWLPFSKLLNGYPVIVGILALVLLGGIFLYKWWKDSRQDGIQKIAAAFVLIYSFFMLIVATISRFETMNNRLLSPLYIPLLLSVGLYLYASIQAIRSAYFKKSLLILFFVIGSVCTYEELQWDFASYKEYKEGGIGGYSDDDWLISSGLLNYLVTHPGFFTAAHLPIYSNAAHAVYFRTGQHIQILPERKYLDQVKAFHQKPKQLLIWFNEEDNAEVLTLEEVGNTKNLQILSKFNDGVIYLCTSK
jgi:hypothetical protein